MKAKYILTVSAPYFATCSSGSTTLPFDLDIFCPSGPMMIPWLRRDRNGSEKTTRFKILNAFGVKREYRRCIVLWSAPPKYNGMGNQLATFGLDANSSLFFGSA